MQEKPLAKLALFIDGENCYNSCLKKYNHGVFFPHLLAVELCAKQDLHQGCRDIVLADSGVNFYTGMPTQRQNPKQNAKRARKLELYKQFGVCAFPRPLALTPYSCPKCASEKPRECQTCRSVDKPQCPDCGAVESGLREKGVDVHLAVDVLSRAIQGGIDIVAIASADTDFVPLKEQFDVLKEKGIINPELEFVNIIFGKHRGFCDPKYPVGPRLFERIKDENSYSNNFKTLVAEHEKYIQELAEDHPTIYGMYDGFKFNQDHRLNSPEYLMKLQ